MNLDLLPWSIAEGAHEGSPVIFRFRTFPESFQRSAFPSRIHLFWTFQSPTPDGLPSPSDSSQAAQFEDRLIEAVEADNHSVLSLVLTGKGLREFSFHTTDPQGFIGRLSNMPQEKARYPIEIDCYEDPTWDYVERVLSDIAR